MQLQLQLIIHFLPVPSGFHFYTRQFPSLLRVCCALPTVNCRLLRRHVHDVTLTRAAITDITLSRTTLALAAIFCPKFGTRSRQKRWKRSNIVGPYTPYGLSQTKAKMCAKVWFRLVQKCKFVQGTKKTNKQTFSFIYKIYMKRHTQHTDNILQVFCFLKHT
jgi:hypothetical protein